VSEPAEFEIVTREAVEHLDGQAVAFIDPRTGTVAGHGTLHVTDDGLSVTYRLDDSDAAREVAAAIEAAGSTLSFGPPLSPITLLEEQPLRLESPD